MGYCFAFLCLHDRCSAKPACSPAAALVTSQLQTGGSEGGGERVLRAPRPAPAAADPPPGAGGLGGPDDVARLRGYVSPADAGAPEAAPNVIARYTKSRGRPPVGGAAAYASVL